MCWTSKSVLGNSLNYFLALDPFISNSCLFTAQHKVTLQSDSVPLLQEDLSGSMLIRSERTCDKRLLWSKQQGFKTTEGGQLLPVVEQGWWFAWALPSLMFSGLIRRFERRWKWAVSALGLFWSEGMGGRHVIWQLYLQSLRYKSTFGCQRLGCQSEHHSVGRHPTCRQYFCSSSQSLSKYMLTLLLPSNTSKHHWFGRATQKRGKYNNLLSITCRSRCGALCDDAQCSLTLVLRAPGAGGRQEWECDHVCLPRKLSSLFPNRGTTAVDGAGFGIDRPAELTKEDDEYEAFRKRMMLAYRFRPNPLVRCPTPDKVTNPLRIWAHLTRVGVFLVLNQASNCSESFFDSFSFWINSSLAKHAWMHSFPYFFFLIQKLLVLVFSGTKYKCCTQRKQMGRPRICGVFWVIVFLIAEGF